MEYKKLISQPDCNVDTFRLACTDKGLLVKEWDDRLLVTYPNASSTTAKSDSNDAISCDFTDPFVRQSRGIILGKSEDNGLQVLCHAMDKLDHSAELTTEQLRERFDAADGEVEELIDGSLIKLYWYNDQWKIATNRCIEARKARWSNYRTFYDMFQEAATASGLDYAKLDQGHCYSFVLCHPENRIVMNHPEPKLIHVATRSIVTLSECDQDIGIEQPLVMKLDFDTFQERLKTNVWYFAGYVIKKKYDGANSEGTSYKRTVVECDNYLKVKAIKGNCRDPVYRYLQLQREDADKFKEFCAYYPEYKWVDMQLESLAREAHRMYMDFFVKHDKKGTRINRDLWELMSELHTLFLRTKEPTSLQKVRQHLKSYPIDKLTRLSKMK